MHSFKVVPARNCSILCEFNGYISALLSKVSLFVGVIIALQKHFCILSQVAMQCRLCTIIEVKHDKFMTSS